MHVLTRLPLSFSPNPKVHTSHCKISELPDDILIHIYSYSLPNCSLLFTTRRFTDIPHTPKFLCLFRSPIHRRPLQLFLEHLIERSLSERQLPELAWRNLYAIVLHRHGNVPSAIPVRPHAHTFRLCRRTPIPAPDTSLITQLNTDCTLKIMSFLDARGNAILQTACVKFLQTSVKSRLWKNLCEYEENKYSPRLYRGVFVELAYRLILSPPNDTETIDSLWTLLSKQRLLYARHQRSVAEFQLENMPVRKPLPHTKLYRMTQTIKRWSKKTFSKYRR